MRRGVGEDAEEQQTTERRRRREDDEREDAGAKACEGVDAAASSAPSSVMSSHPFAPVGYGLGTCAHMVLRAKGAAAAAKAVDARGAAEERLPVGCGSRGVLLPFSEAARCRRR